MLNLIVNVVCAISVCCRVYVALSARKIFTLKKLVEEKGVEIDIGTAVSFCIGTSISFQTLLSFRNHSRF